MMPQKSPRPSELFELWSDFRAGKNTLEIAQERGLSEAAVYNAIHHVREELRRREAKSLYAKAYYAANKHEIKLRRCGVIDTRRPSEPPPPSSAGDGATGSANAAPSLSIGQALPLSD